MSANSASWLSTHGRLWYDDRWYRIAWLVWPQAVGLLLFVTLWLNHPAGQGFIPWAKPVAEPVKTLPAAAPTKEQTSPAQTQQPVDVLAPCKGNNEPQIILDCSALLASGNLKGDNIPYAYWHRGWAYYQTKQYQLAMNDYNRAISLLPTVAEFYGERGMLWIDLENSERALPDFDQAVLLKPGYALAFLNRGIALYKLKRPNESLVAFNKALELDSSLARAYEYRASINEGRADWRAVYDDGNKLINLQPNYRMGYEYRGHAYLEAGQQQAAINDFTKSISLDPTAIYGYRMRGRAYYLLNQYDSAMADYQAALRIDPNDSDTISFVNELKRRQRGK